MSDTARELRRDPIACDPARLCRELGLDRPMKRQARGVIICCPSHNEKDPSCSVRIAKDDTIAVKCQACGWSADAIGLVGKVFGLDFRESLTELARITGRYDLIDSNEARRDRPVARPQPPAPAPEPTLTDERFDEIASAVLERCPLRSQSDVMAYLESRGLEAEAEMAGLAALPPPAEQPGIVAELRTAFGTDLDVSGLAKGALFSFAENRLVIPWRARSGRVDTLQRRRIDAGDARDPRYVFPRGRGLRTLFGIDLFDDAVVALNDDAEVIVSEGALDGLARRKLARMAGLRAVVVAVPSATTLLEDVITELADGRDLVLSLDADDAGDRAAERLSAAAWGRARSVTRERPSNAKDMGELLMRRLRA